MSRARQGKEREAAAAVILLSATKKAMMMRRMMKLHVCLQGIIQDLETIKKGTMTLMARSMPRAPRTSNKQQEQDDEECSMDDDDDNHAASDGEDASVLRAEATNEVGRQNKEKQSGGGRQPDQCWQYLSDEKDQHNEVQTYCKSCRMMVKHHRRTAKVKAHLRRCQPFQKSLVTVVSSDIPEWMTTQGRRGNSNKKQKNTSNSMLGFLNHRKNTSDSDFVLNVTSPSSTFLGNSTAASSLSNYPNKKKTTTRRQQQQ